jgi:hypothetical protein
MDYEYESERASKVTAALLRDNFGRNDRRRARVSLIGRFDADDTLRYGHLNGLRFRFLVMKVEKAQPVPPDVEWPFEVRKQ